MDEAFSVERENTRPRGKRPFYVWVTPEERAEIERLAAATSLSASRYLRTSAWRISPNPPWTQNAWVSC